MESRSKWFQSFYTYGKIRFASRAPFVFSHFCACMSLLVTLAPVENSFSINCKFDDVWLGLFILPGTKGRRLKPALLNAALYYLDVV